MIVNLDYLPRAGGVMTGDVAFPTGKSILVGGIGDMNDGVRVSGIAIGSGYYALNIAHAEYDSPVLLRGVGDPEQDTDAVNKGYVYETVPHLGAVRPSILDNGLFCGSGLPVNQRGDTSWTTSGYHIDRWKHIQNTDDFPGSSVSGSIQSDGLHIGSGGIFEQPIEPDVLDCLAGKQITVSALVKAIGFGTFTTTVNTSGSYGSVVGSGGCSISIDYTNNNFKISNEMSSEIIVKGVKIEEGDTQTLAYQDDTGAWQLLPQPESDYATQLAKCQRYLMDITPNIAFNPAYFGQTGEGEAVFLVPTPVTMRIEPSVICNPDKIQIALNNGTFPVPTAVSVMLHTQGGVIIRCTVDMSGIAAFSPCDFRSSDITSKILLSAEL